MRNPDILLRAAVCPAWGALSWFQRERGAGGGRELYGDSDDSKKKNDLPLGASIGLLVALVALPVVFFFWPLIKAFTCGNAPTSLGGTGLLWGLLIFFVPPLGIIYLFFGHCVRPVEARQQLMQGAGQLDT